VHGLIVRLPKVETDPEFEVKVIEPEEQADLYGTFMAVKDVWEWQQKQDAAWRAAQAPAGTAA
jgi:hypothetical protein